MTNNPHNTDNQSDMSTTTGNSWTPFAAKQGMWTDGTGDTSGFSHIVRLPARIVPPVSYTHLTLPTSDLV